MRWPSVAARREIGLRLAAALLLAGGCVAAAPEPRPKARPIPTPVRIEPARVEAPRPEYHFAPGRFGELLDAKARFVYRDPAIGCTIESDLDPTVVTSFFAPALEQSAQELSTILKNADARRLVVRLHAAPPQDVDGVVVDAVHRECEVHVFALDDAGSPSPHAVDHLRHELVHAFLFLSNSTPPRWLEEGLAQTLSNLIKDSAGNLEPLPRADFIIGLAQLHREKRAMDLESILAAKDAYPDPKQLGAFYVGAWSFTFEALAQQEGPLPSRVAALLLTPDDRLLTMKAEWVKQCAAGDAAAPWLPLVKRKDTRLDDAAESALRALDATISWWRCIDSFTLDDRPSARRHAARLLVIAPAESRTFDRLRQLIADEDGGVRRDAMRSLYSNEAIRRDGEADLRRLRSTEGSLLASSIALALRGERDELAAACELLAIEKDERCVIDALLAIRSVLPDSAPIPRADELLAPSFDARRVVSALASWVESNSAALRFDAGIPGYVVTPSAAVPTLPR